MSLTRVRYQEDDNDDQGLFTNRSTMMANFEEWIKMATDNKINSKNSWNFALIDYFHDLNVLRDSENNINFQKASATLDGCVKIYSSRVDSVTTETGKLLSGLAQKKHSSSSSTGDNNGRNRDEANVNSGEDEEDGVYIDPATGLPVANDTDAQSKRRIYNRVLETTLVDFESIAMKELDKELNIDPLFKKALVEFDEGGAKSLLLNTLNIDSSGRVIFDTAIKDGEKKPDSNDDLPNENEQKNNEKEDKEDEDTVNSTMNTTANTVHDETVNSIPPIGEDIDNSSIVIEDEILSLGMDYVKFSEISRCEISSSIQQLRSVVADITMAKNFIDTVNGRFDNFLTDGELQDVAPDADMEDANSESIGLQDEYSYISQKEENFDNNEQPQSLDMDEGEDPTMSVETPNINENNNGMDSMFEVDLMAYFDESLKRNWRGRENWKVRNLKKNSFFSGLNGVEKPRSLQNEINTDKKVLGSESTTKKNKKQTEIDFFARDDNLEDTIFAPKNRTNIDLPLKYRKNDSHYLLPNDYHFSTQRITKLFIKPGQMMSIFNRKQPTETLPITREANTLTTPEPQDGLEIADEHFWAENYDRKQREQKDGEDAQEQQDVVNAMLDNPFDDDDVGVDFNQAFEEEDGADSVPLDNAGKLSSEDNKVNYARVSKKVDVKKLKNNLWKSIKVLVKKEQNTNEHHAEIINIRFTDIADEICQLYPTETRKDISTSFCFICLLHLANEFGLKISNTENYEDLIVSYNINTTDEKGV